MSRDIVYDLIGQVISETNSLEVIRYSAFPLSISFVEIDIIYPEWFSNAVMKYG